MTEQGNSDYVAHLKRELQDVFSDFQLRHDEYHSQIKNENEQRDS